MNIMVEFTKSDGEKIGIPLTQIKKVEQLVTLDNNCVVNGYEIKESYNDTIKRLNLLYSSGNNIIEEKEI